jgi:hypothetical protein
VIAWWHPADEPRMIRTRDGGRHWQEVSHQFLQKIRFFDDSRGYGVAVTKFLRTSDSGLSWTETEIPHVRFIDRMLFLMPDIGWIAGTDGKDFSVFRTTNGGRDWEESRTTTPKELGTFEISSSSTTIAAGSSLGTSTTAPISIRPWMAERPGYLRPVHPFRERANGLESCALFQKRMDSSSRTRPIVIALSIAPMVV